MNINIEFRRMNEIKNILEAITSKMSIPLYLVFIITDYLYVPQFFLFFTGIRVGIIILILLIRKKVKTIENLKDAQSLAIQVVAINCVPIAIMIWFINDLSTPYYAGLNLVAIGSISFIPLRKKYLFWMAGLIYGPFLLMSPFLSYEKRDLSKFLINLFFIMGTITISMVISYFNKMIRKQEQEALEKLEIKVVEIQQQKSQIDEKNRSLIKIGELATKVAHDIRSPVMALQTVSQVLGEETDPKKKKLIENAAKRISDIADKLVAEYRENLTQDLNSVKIDRAVTLNSLIEDVIEEKNLSLDHKHKIIFKSLNNMLVPENIDSTEFQRLISNIINNSIEAFDKENGLVEIELFKIDGNIQIKIQDNGKGIPLDKISKIFEEGVSGKPTGTGLGLAQVKKYLSSINGSVKVKSEVGKGTLMEVYLTC